MCEYVCTVVDGVIVGSSLRWLDSWLSFGSIWRVFFDWLAVFVELFRFVLSVTAVL